MTVTAPRQLYEQVGQRIKDAMRSVHLRVEDFGKLRQYFSFGSEISARNFVSQARNGFQQNVEVSRMTQVKLDRLSKLLYMLQIDENEPAISMLKTVHPNFVYPPKLDEAAIPLLQQIAQRAGTGQAATAQQSPLEQSVETGRDASAIEVKSNMPKPYAYDGHTTYTLPGLDYVVNDTIMHPTLGKGTVMAVEVADPRKKGRNPYEEKEYKIIVKFEKEKPIPLIVRKQPSGINPHFAAKTLSQ